MRRWRITSKQTQGIVSPAPRGLKEQLRLKPWVFTSFYHLLTLENHTFPSIFTPEIGRRRPPVGPGPGPPRASESPAARRRGLRRRGADRGSLDPLLPRRELMEIV